MVIREAEFVQQLQYWVADKMTNDPAWQAIRVILSGHEVSQHP